MVIIRKHPSGWWDGCSTKSAQRGWLPSNHVEVVDAHSIVLDQAMRATVGKIEGAADGERGEGKRDRCQGQWGGREARGA